MRSESILRWLMPLAIAAVGLGAWEWAIAHYEVPKYILPAPSLIATTLVTDFASLAASWWVTLQITVMGLAVAVVGGVGLAILFSQWRWLELSLFPYAVILQVTPMVAIAPLLIIWLDPNIKLALLVMAWIVAFFPILSNTVLGLRSADHNLLNLFQLYGATRWQVLWHLQLPTALPYFLGGLRIAGGLALIGAVVAEFAAGTGGADTGLAFRILESGYRLNIARMFAALLLVSATGVIIFAFFTLLSHLLLRKWHESAARREN